MRDSQGGGWIVAALTIAAIACAARLIAAAYFPLSGDEAYYWEWSRRLAFGYVDHPPLVAWLIAAVDRGARNAALIRLAFILCGAFAAWFAYDFARRASGSIAAGALAALLVLCSPLATLTFVFATPDGPFLLCWTASMAFALRAFETGERRWWAALGVSLACAILARLFGFALLVGIVLAAVRALRTRSVDPRGPIIAAAISGAAVVLIVLWNAENGWAGLRFAFESRHAWLGFSPFRSAQTLALGVSAGALFASPFVIAAVPRLASLRTTWARIAWYCAVPLLSVLAVLSAFESIEIYWLAGPFICLLVAVAVIYAQKLRTRRALVFSLAPSIVLTLAVAAGAIAPPKKIVELFHVLPVRASASSPFEIYTYRLLARDLHEKYGGVPVLTDGYGLSSILDFYGDLQPLVIGYNAQGREAARWFHVAPRTDVIYVDPVPLERRPDMHRRLSAACKAVRLLPPLVYPEAHTVLHAYSVTRCVDFGRGPMPQSRATARRRETPRRRRRRMPLQGPHPQRLVRACALSNTRAPSTPSGSTLKTEAAAARRAASMRPAVR